MRRLVIDNSTINYMPSGMYDHKNHPTCYKKGSIPWTKGKKRIITDEWRKKISETKKGKMPTNFGNGFGGKGENHYNWKGGITPINKKIRTSRKYKDWRTAVFERDNFTCQQCGSRGYELHADHIKPFAFYPELRLVIENGRTLCAPCHRKTDTYAGKLNNKKYEPFGKR